MKVEVLIILLIVLILILWALWFRFTTWIYSRRYKPENDKGRLAEERRRELGRTIETPNGTYSIPRLVPTPERTILPSESSIPTVENRRRFRNPFKRK